MKQCKKCIFYDEMFDMMHQSDVVVEGEEQNEVHYCNLFRDGIPNLIINNQKKCEHFIEEALADEKQ